MQKRRKKTMVCVWRAVTLVLHLEASLQQNRLLKCANRGGASLSTVNLYIYISQAKTCPVHQQRPHLSDFPRANERARPIALATLSDHPYKLCIFHFLSNKLTARRKNYRSKRRRAEYRAVVFASQQESVRARRKNAVEKLAPGSYKTSGTRTRHTWWAK